MKKLTKPALWVLSFFFVAFFACNDPTVIGSDLLSGDQLDIEFTDTLTLKARTIPNDSLVVWRTGTNAVLFQNFTFGDFQDPVFGRTVASVYAQYVTNSNLPKFDPSQILDSVVLMLPYNASLSYGKLDEQFTIEVYEMAESLDPDEEYTNSDSFSVSAVPLAVHSFIPNLTDSITVLEPNSDTLRQVKSPAHLRIKLDPARFVPFFSLDSATIANDSSFLEYFKGLWLKPSSQNAGLLSFKMRDPLSNLRFYYRDGTDTLSYDFRIFSGNPVVLHQRNYYTGTTVEPYISQAGEERPDDLIFLQGLNGLNFELEIPYAEEMRGIIINKAELVLPIISLNNDNDKNGPVAQLYATEVVSDTTLLLIDDIYLPLLNLATDDFGNYFGGKAVADEDFYKVSLSAHLQKVIDGSSTKKIRFTVHLRNERAARVVLGGPSNTTSPAKLRLSFTRY
ncbi:MAG: DUF4270 family protein [Saprospiraceae bacterium]|nr:DUF4270 family protein [Saprospiraceae bacterium]